MARVRAVWAAMAQNVVLKAALWRPAHPQPPVEPPLAGAPPPGAPMTGGEVLRKALNEQAGGFVVFYMIGRKLDGAPLWAWEDDDYDWAWAFLGLWVTPALLGLVALCAGCACVGSLLRRAPSSAGSRARPAARSACSRRRRCSSRVFLAFLAQRLDGVGPTRSPELIVSLLLAFQVRSRARRRRRRRGGGACRARSRSRASERDPSSI